MSLRLSRQFVHQLGVLATVEDAELEKLEQALDRTTGAIDRPEQLIARAAEELDLALAEVLIRQVLGYASMTLQAGLSGTQAMDAAHELIVAEVEPDGQPAAHRGLVTVERLARLSSVRRTAHAIDLSYDCPNLLQRTRILTDIRPLFSEEGDAMEGGVVSHSLRIRYDTAGLPREMSFALDEQDLRALQSQCERALRKGATARTALSQKANIPMLNPREPNDD